MEISNFVINKLISSVVKSFKSVNIGAYKVDSREFS